MSFVGLAWQVAVVVLDRIDLGFHEGVVGPQVVGQSDSEQLSEQLLVVLALVLKMVLVLLPVPAL